MKEEPSMLLERRRYFISTLGINQPGARRERHILTMAW